MGCSDSKFADGTIPTDTILGQMCEEDEEAT